MVARAAVLVLAACSLDACSCTDSQAPPPPPPDPSTVAVLVVPSRVSVSFDPAAATGSRDVSFTLQVMTRDADGNALEPDAGSVTWTVPAGVIVVGDGTIATLKVAETVPMPFTVLAKVNGIATVGSAKIERSTGTGGDVVFGEHASGSLAAVLLTSGATSTSPCEESATAFVWRGDLPNLRTAAASAGCRDDAMLLWSGASAAQLHPAGWTVNTDRLNAMTGTAPFVPAPAAKRLTLTPKFFIGVSDWLCHQAVEIPDCDLAHEQQWARETAVEELQLAQTIFERNRVGVELVYDPTLVVDKTELASVHNCDAAIQWALSPPAQVAHGDVAVLWLDDLDAVGGGPARAVTCGRATSDGALVLGDDRKLILISSPDQWITSVLVHELGHALGLTEPGYGHTDGVGLQISGFGRHNVMAETDNLVFPRMHFTLGQVYRMNADTRSLLQAAGLRPAGGVDCGCNPLATKSCPALGRDIAPLERTVTWTGTCSTP